MTVVFATQFEASRAIRQVEWTPPEEVDEDGVHRYDPECPECAAVLR